MTESPFLEIDKAWRGPLGILVQVVRSRVANIPIDRHAAAACPDLILRGRYGFDARVPGVTITPCGELADGTDAGRRAAAASSSRLTGLR